jgi:hypothetical protein
LSHWNSIAEPFLKVKKEHTLKCTPVDHACFGVLLMFFCPFTFFLLLVQQNLNRQEGEEETFPG